MATPQALVLTGFGINCDYETALAFELAGATARRMHVNDLIEEPSLAGRYQIMALPGGFSFGDNIASGKVLANKLKYRMGEAFRRFLAEDRLVIGICNGFQVLVRLGLLPDGPAGMAGQSATLTHNDSGKFESRWVRVTVSHDTRCVFTRGITRMDLPVRHGEGKFVVLEERVLERIKAGGQVVMRYAAEGGESPTPYPANPNGSVDSIAGVCDPTGRVFGLMPHPEAFLHRKLHPQWTRRVLPEEGDGLAIFRNAVNYFN